jgi:N-methylhydantoinase B
VLRDVRNEFLSVAKAAADYGVVIAGDAVDEAATTRLRAEHRARRGWAEPPKVLRAEPLPQAAE